MTNPTSIERLRYLARELRSGKHEETAGSLKLGGQRCALGVACDIILNESQTGLEWSPVEEGARCNTFWCPETGERHSAMDEVRLYFMVPNDAICRIAGANDEANEGERHAAAAKAIDRIIGD